jgi:hypothetical protein
MKSKIFSYKVEGVLLTAVDDNLQLSEAFDRKAVLEHLKEVVKTGNWKVDERSLDFKIVDGQLFIEGIVTENEEPKIIGFRQVNS